MQLNEWRSSHALDPVTDTQWAKQFDTANAKPATQPMLPIEPQ